MVIVEVGMKVVHLDYLSENFTDHRAMLKRAVEMEHVIDPLGNGRLLYVQPSRSSNGTAVWVACHIPNVLILHADLVLLRDTWKSQTAYTVFKMRWGVELFSILESFGYEIDYHRKDIDGMIRYHLQLDQRSKAALELLVEVGE